MATSSFVIGDLVDRRYKLRRVIGAGAAAVVYEAFHQVLRRSIALKTPVTDRRGGTVDMRKKRLLREAHILSELRHPGVVSVLDAGETVEGHAYLAMELLEGKTLEALLATRGALPV